MLFCLVCPASAALPAVALAAEPILLATRAAVPDMVSECAVRQVFSPISCDRYARELQMLIGVQMYPML